MPIEENYLCYTETSPNILEPLLPLRIRHIIYKELIMHFRWFSLGLKLANITYICYHPPLHQCQ